MSDTGITAQETTDEKLSYAEAVNAALRRCLRDIPETLFYGEDIAKPGGVFGVSKGIAKDFPERVFDTPISESAILGSAVGAAMLGRRPIVEIMWFDFALVAFDQLVNQMANVRYVSQGRLAAPIVVRTQQGNAPGACAQHSQNLEALVLHIPGLRVCMPWTAQDAYDFLVAAVYHDDPVIFIENRTLYWGDKQPVTLGGPVQRPGAIRVRREGSHATLVTWGAMTGKALQAAEQLAPTGIDVEVIETPWLNPLDLQPVLDSVSRTGRLAVVHEANVTGGYGAEIVARVAEAGVRLVSPPIRIGAPDIRIPSAPSLAAAVVPSAEQIADGLHRLARP